MPDKNVDLINEKNEVIGREKESIARKKNLLRRIAHIFIFNSKGELILQKRSKNHPKSPGKLTCSVSGHVQAGEDYLTGAKRELKEELGIDIDLHFIDCIHINGKSTNAICGFFVGKYDGKFNIDPKEVDSMVPMSLKEIRKKLHDQPELFGSHLTTLLHRWMDKEAKNLG